MNQADFSSMLDESFERIRSILDAKSVEYTPGKDRLANFIKASSLTGETVNQAIAGMLVKHVVSIFDMIEAEGDHQLDTWDEKIFDTINYLLLLRASVIDNLREKQSISPAQNLPPVYFDSVGHPTVPIANPERLNS